MDNELEKLVLRVEELDGPCKSYQRGGLICCDGFPQLPACHCGEGKVPHCLDDKYAPPHIIDESGLPRLSVYRARSQEMG